MTLYRFAVHDEMNDWAKAVDRAESRLFARRTVSSLPFKPERSDGLVHLTLEDR